MKTEPPAHLYEDTTLISDLDKARPTGVDAYAFALRQNVRAFWNGLRDFDQYLETLNDTIRFYLPLAWDEGAKTCGILPNERTPEEERELQNFILNQLSYTVGLAEFIEQHTRAEGGLLRTSLDRLPPWVNRYNEVKALAQQMACGDQKYVWRLGGGTIEHCRTCLKLNGRVMRASRWRELDVRPQDTRPNKLACHGYRCDCRLERTNRPATPGKLPRLS